MASSGRTLHRNAQCALLDIEGTVADIRFVYDVMFPYVRRELKPFLETRWNEPAVAHALELLATDTGTKSSNDAWGIGHADRGSCIERVVAAVEGLMDVDSKTTGLKAIQGLIWESGFRSGALRAEIFSDVLPALTRWQSHGIDLRIYSSGSILAQKLFFGHTTLGDLTPMFSANYDTTIGSKRDAASYARIAEDCRLAPKQIVFLSDVAAELDAAIIAGMQIVACIRPNNAPLGERYQSDSLESFDALDLTSS